MLEPEPVFDDMKNDRDFKRFLPRGLSTVNLEIGWLSLPTICLRRPQSMPKTKELRENKRLSSLVFLRFLSYFADEGAPRFIFGTPSFASWSCFSYDPPVRRRWLFGFLLFWLFNVFVCWFPENPGLFAAACCCFFCCSFWRIASAKSIFRGSLLSDMSIISYRERGCSYSIRF